MRQCQKCSMQNNEESSYCEGCGTLLRAGETSRPTSLPYQQEDGYMQPSSTPIQYPVPEMNYMPLPAPPTYDQGSYAPTRLATSEQGFSSNRGFTGNTNERKRSTVGLVLGILLYLLGGLTASFGLASMLLSTGNSTFAGAGFLIASAVSILALIFILILHRHPKMRGWLRVVLFVGLSLLSFIAIVVVFATKPTGQDTTPAEFFSMGIICLIYGSSMAVIALL